MPRWRNWQTHETQNLAVFDTMSVRLRPPAPKKIMNTQKSIFSKIIDREIPAEIITETEYLIVIKDISPQAPIHFLIIPKKNIENITTMNEKDFELGEKIFSMANWLSKNISGASQFKLLINNGYEAGQRVFHLHAHFMSGF